MEIPPVAVSWGRTDVFPTGSWRNITPHYVHRLPRCRAGCPVGNDVAGWLRQVGEGAWEEAVRLLIEEQPLPATCGRVCYHPCELSCNRGQFDERLNIRGIERRLGAKAAEWSSLPTRRESGGGARVLIVGAGPAGLAAAWTLARLNHHPVVVDRASEPGGLLRFGIPGYRLPRRILRGEIERLRALGVEFQCGVNIQTDESLAELRAEYDAVFLSPGAAGHRSMGLTTQRKGVTLGAIDFLASIRRDEPYPLGSKVVVIGGGNSAIDAARSALRLGAEVTVVYRRTRAEMPAYREEVEAALAEGIKIMYLISPLSIERANAGLRLFLVCLRNVLGKPDNSGRRRPEPIPGSEFEIEITNVIDAVGEFADPEQLTPNPAETTLLMKPDAWGRTDVEGVFAGGDFTNRDRTVAHAIGAGKRGGLAIDAWLSGSDPAALTAYQLGVGGAVSVGAYVNGVGLGYDSLDAVRFEHLNPAYFDPALRFVQSELDLSARSKAFTEIVSGLTDDEAQREAQRCFHCGDCDSCGNCHVFCPDGAVRRDPETLALSFDLKHCKGCGICASECPRAAIEMRK